MSEQFKALVTCDDPESPLMSNMFHGRLGYEVLQVSMGKEYIDVLRICHRSKKNLKYRSAVKTVCTAAPFRKTLKGVYL